MMGNKIFGAILLLSMSNLGFAQSTQNVWVATECKNIDWQIPGIGSPSMGCEGAMVDRLRQFMPFPGGHHYNAVAGIESLGSAFLSGSLIPGSPRKSLLMVDNDFEPVGGQTGIIRTSSVLQ